MKNNNFDFLRFLFAFTVVVSHASLLSGIPELKILTKIFDTNLAVNSFFIISGYLITQSYLQTNNNKVYFQKRARRLLPAYITVIVICAFLFSTISQYSFYEYFSDKKLYKYLVSNLLFLNFIQPSLPGVFTHQVTDAVNGALWTIKVEVSFYLLVPLLILFFNRFAKKYRIFIAIYLFSLGYQYLFRHLYQTSNWDLYRILEYQLPGSMTFFISGIALYYYHGFITKHVQKLIIPAILIFSTEYYFNLNYLFPFSLAIIIFYLAFRFKRLNNFGKYGDFSYGIYIYHFPFVQLMVYLGLFRSNNPWLALLLILVSVVIIGMLSWHLMEKKYVKRHLKKII